MGLHPEATAREVVDELKTRGIRIAPQLVYTLRSSSKRNGKKAPARPGANILIADMLAVLDLARKMGMHNLREIVNRLPD